MRKCRRPIRHKSMWLLLICVGAAAEWWHLGRQNRGAERGGSTWVSYALPHIQNGQEANCSAARTGIAGCAAGGMPRRSYFRKVAMGSVHLTEKSRPRQQSAALFKVKCKCELLPRAKLE